MKSKAHSKKCQETGVLEELEAEEGEDLSAPPPPSFLTIPLPSPLLLALLLCPLHAQPSTFSNHWRRSWKSQNDHPAPRHWLWIRSAGTVLPVQVERWPLWVLGDCLLNQ